MIDASPSTAQTEAFADWIEKTAHGKQTKYFFATYAHPDHYFGFRVLQKRFSSIKPLATAKVLEHIEHSYGQVDASKPNWASLGEANEIDLDGHVLKACVAVQGDCSTNGFLHVPSLDLVVAGDLVYGECYQYLVEAKTAEKRANWIKAVGQNESLEPKIIVYGHKSSSQIDGACLTRAKEYIRLFERELEKAESAEELKKKTVEMCPERWNLFILQRSCEGSFANKGR